MTDTVEAPESVRPPRMIVLAFAVTIAHVVLSIANSAMLWGFQDYLRDQLVKNNAKADKPKANYDLSPANIHNVNHDLHNGLTVGLVQIVIFSLLVMLLAWSFRKGKGWARWAEILVLIIVVQAPFRLLNLGGSAPILMRAMSGLVGLTGIAIIVLLVLPESSKYFAAVRVATGRDRAGAPTGLRGMFAPRPRPSDAAPAPRARARQQARPSASDKDVVKPQEKAVVRPPAGPSEKAAAPVPPDSVAADRRAKSKVRAGADTGAPEQGPTASRPPTSAAKSRGKSRRTS